MAAAAGGRGRPCARRPRRPGRRLSEVRANSDVQASVTHSSSAEHAGAFRSAECGRGRCGRVHAIGVRGRYQDLAVGETDVPIVVVRSEEGVLRAWSPSAWQGEEFGKSLLPVLERLRSIGIRRGGTRLVDRTLHLLALCPKQGKTDKPVPDGNVARAARIPGTKRKVLSCTILRSDFAEGSVFTDFSFAYLVSLRARKHAYGHPFTSVVVPPTIDELLVRAGTASAFPSV